MLHLDNVFLKLDRADEKVAALSANIATFCRDHPITLDARLREGRLGANFVCQMGGMVAPLKVWSLDLGEVAYSLRSALDNLIYVCACLLADPPPNPRALQFPIVQDAREYSEARKKIAPQLPVDIADLLEKMQPFHRSRPDTEGRPEDDPLVLLNWISNHDKHRMPVPFLIPPKVIEFTQMCEFASEADAAANIPPDVVVHGGPLSDGRIVLEYRTKHPVTKVSGQINITVQVAFETNAGTLGVSEAIGHLAWYTRLVIDEFSNRIG